MTVGVGDIVDGGAGTDTFIIPGNSMFVTASRTLNGDVLVHYDQTGFFTTPPTTLYSFLRNVEQVYLEEDQRYLSIDELLNFKPDFRNFIAGTDGDDPNLYTTSLSDVVTAGSGNDIITVRAPDGTDGGDDVIDGGPDADYDQVNYYGSSFDFVFVRNMDGSVTVTKPEGGVDTLINIDGVWFSGEQAWYPMDQLTVRANLIEGTDGNDRYELRLVGTDGDDIMAGGAGHDVFLPKGGNNIVDGANMGDAVGQPGTGWNYYDQVDYDGSPGDYVFERQGDAVIVHRPDGGTDTLYNIDGFWFNGSQEWRSIDSFLTGATEGDDHIVLTGETASVDALGGRDVIVSRATNAMIDGGGPEYDQVDYDGSRSDYVFERQGDAVIVTKPGGGHDTLHDIDGFWFAGSQEWASIQDVLATTIPTDGNDFLQYTDPPGLFQMLGGADTADIINFSGVIIGGVSDGVEVFDNEYDQVNLPGSLSDYSIEGGGYSAPNSILLTNGAGWQLDLVGIDGLWFEGEQAWYDIYDAADGGSWTGTTGDDRLRGTSGDDEIRGFQGSDQFIESAGNNYLYGSSINSSDGDYDQVTYLGSSSDYTFSIYTNNALPPAAPRTYLQINRPDGGWDRVQDIQGLWFEGDHTWLDAVHIFNDLLSTSSAEVQTADFGLADNVML